ncbi:MAG: MmgE/PrpD family protein, partial [Hyphomicrobiaceae bacterium]
MTLQAKTEPAITQLARYVATGQPDYNADVRTTIRHALIDTLGCILAGAREPVARQTLETARNWGAGEAPVYGTGVHLPAPWAAMVNATAAHALEFDDWEVPGNTHPSAVLIPALLAAAASGEHTVSGADIVDAYAMGFEVIARIGEAVNFEHYNDGFHSTATLGAIGAAGGVTRLMKLDAETTANALALSVSQAIGYACQF